jgi:dihydrofolate reductase
LILSILAAMDEQRGIGKDNQIPWKAPKDLKRFRSLTMGHHLIMGRKTCESIGTLLDGRTSIVLTHQLDFQATGFLIAYSLQEAYLLAQDHNENEAFIIGGGEIFAETIGTVNRMYLTTIHLFADCDVFFPEFSLDDWEIVESIFHAADQKNPFDLSFLTLNRKNQLQRHISE